MWSAKCQGKVAEFYFSRGVVTLSQPCRTQAALVRGELTPTPLYAPASCDFLSYQSEPYNLNILLSQIAGLPFGLKGACLHTNQTKAQRAKILENISSGNIAVLLLSPEALVGSGSGGGCLPTNAKLPPIGFACIDEAHCLSEWSHNFRPSYLRVCKVMPFILRIECTISIN